MPPGFPRLGAALPVPLWETVGSFWRRWAVVAGSCLAQPHVLLALTAGAGGNCGPGVFADRC